MSDSVTPASSVEISTVKTGDISIVPPTFLEKWGIVLVICAGGWILLVASVLMAYYLWKAPVPPTDLSAEQLKDASNSYRIISEQWRDSLTYIFDLLVTKTVLPIVTLLLGYLFGRSKGLG